MKKKPPKSTKKTLLFDLEENAADLFTEHLKELDSDLIEKDKLNTEFSKSTNQIQRSRQKQAKTQLISLDLHGKTLVEAQNEVQHKIQELLKSSQSGFTLRIITGKGLHSPGGEGVLATEIWRFVNKKYAGKFRQIDASPADVKLGGRLIRGHFDVVF
ncbi:MAG: Smr/MutS family protein [Oligoflexales bacterium]|nr:Smr/MutS family protein [Oligoflexales bacterium]